MGRTVVGILYALALVVVIVTMDLVFFRGHGWARLAANVGVALLVAAFWFRFRGGS